MCLFPPVRPSCEPSISSAYKRLRNLNEQDFGISHYTPSAPTLPRTSSFHLVCTASFPSDILPPEVGGKSTVLKWELLSSPKSFTNWSACPFFLSDHNLHLTVSATSCHIWCAINCIASKCLLCISSQLIDKLLFCFILSI